MTRSTAARRNTKPHRAHPVRPLKDRPSQAVLDVGTQPTAPGSARAWTRRILLEWQLTGLSDSAELIVSELVTNALLASPARSRPSIRLTLTLDRGELGVFVRDYCPGVPQPANACDEDENGRGLLLVEALSSRSGWYPPLDGIGTVVWAAVSG